MRPAEHLFTALSSYEAAISLCCRSGNHHSDHIAESGAMDCMVHSSPHKGSRNTRSTNCGRSSRSRKRPAAQRRRLPTGSQTGSLSCCTSYYVFLISTTGSIKCTPSLLALININSIRLLHRAAAARPTDSSPQSVRIQPRRRGRKSPNGLSEWKL